MMLHEDGSIGGLFEDEGHVMQIGPVAHLEEDMAFALLQSSSYDGEEQAHHIQWIDPPKLTTPGTLKTGLLEEGHQNNPKDGEKPDDEDRYVPEDSAGDGPIEEEPAIAKMMKLDASSWGGEKWFP